MLVYRNELHNLFKDNLASFPDEGPVVTALVMVVNGLRVTTEYVCKSTHVCVYAQSVVTSSSPTTSIWSVVINGSFSLKGLTNVRNTTVQPSRIEPLKQYQSQAIRCLT